MTSSPMIVCCLLPSAGGELLQLNPTDTCRPAAHQEPHVLSCSCCSGECGRAEVAAIAVTVVTHVRERGRDITRFQQHVWLSGPDQQ